MDRLISAMWSMKYYTLEYHKRRFTRTTGAVARILVLASCRPMDASGDVSYSLASAGVRSRIHGRWKQTARVNTARRGSSFLAGACGGVGVPSPPGPLRWCRATEG